MHDRNVDRFGLVPPGPETAEDGVEIADRHEVERIAFAGPVAVGRAPRHGGEPAAQLGLVALHRALPFSPGIEFLVARDRPAARESESKTSTPSRPAGPISRTVSCLVPSSSVVKTNPDSSSPGRMSPQPMPWA